MKYCQDYTVIQRFSDCGLLIAKHNQSLQWLVMYGDRILKSFLNKRDADNLAVALITYNGLVRIPGFLFNVILQGYTIEDRVNYLRSIT